MLPAKSRCRLLPRACGQDAASLATEIRNSASSRLASSISVACWSSVPTTCVDRWKGFGLTTMGPSSGLTRRQADSESCHRCRCSQAGGTAPSHLDHPGAVRPVPYRSSLRKEIMFTCCDDPGFRLLRVGLGPERGRPRSRPIHMSADARTTPDSICQEGRTHPVSTWQETLNDDGPVRIKKFPYFRIAATNVARLFHL